MEDTRFYDHMTKMDIKVLRAHCGQVEFFTSNTDLHPYAQKDRQRNRQTDRVLPFYEQRNYFSVYIISVSQINPRLLHLDVYFYDRPSNVTYYVFRKYTLVGKYRRHRAISAVSENTKRAIPMLHRRSVHINPLPDDKF